MREVQVTLPELALLVGTRAALGAGLGLLLADRLSGSQRKAIGWTLVTGRCGDHRPTRVRDAWQAPRQHACRVAVMQRPINCRPGHRV